MKILINGAQVHDFKTFTKEVAHSISQGAKDVGYFGFDLHSFGDCLQGGFLGLPPYDIVVEHADHMVTAMNHHGLVDYCDTMLELIENGGRGLVQEDSRSWYQTTREAALPGNPGGRLGCG